MKQLIAAATVVGALISFTTPVFAGTLPSTTNNSEAAVVTTVETPHSHAALTPDYGFLPD